MKTRAPHWTSAEFVETRVLPIMLAFVVGLLVAGAFSDHQADERLQRALQLAQKFRAVAASSQELVGMYAQACEPLLSLPIESTPELIDTTPQPTPQDALQGPPKAQWAQAAGVAQ